MRLFQLLIAKFKEDSVKLIRRVRYYFKNLLGKDKVAWVLLLLATSLLAFFIGCFIGYSHVGIKDDSKFITLTIPFLSMLGSWVSGVGALFAVVASLYIALRAARENTEELDIQYSLVLVPSMYSSTKTEVHASINITNMKRMRSSIQAVSFNFSNNPDLFILVNPAQLIVGKLPHTLEDYGDRLSLVIPKTIFSLVKEKWFMDNCKGEDVGECTIVVQTTTKRFSKALTSAQTKSFNEQFKEKLTESGV